MAEEIVIVAAARTPIGSFRGSLASIPGPRLGAQAIAGAVERSGVAKDQIDEVYMGTVLPAGVGQAPARQASIFAGLQESVPTTTVNKVCGSGMKTVMMGAAQIAMGDAELVVAGGMENMSRTPHALFASREGVAMGDAQLKDLMIYDGLWDVYNDYHMGNAAELCAREYGFGREVQDEFATQSYQKAQAAIDNGYFQEEIIPVEVPQRKGDPLKVSEDEEPKRVKFDRITTLKPAFQKDGTVTAANASSINDGAAAVVLASRQKAEEMGLPILATIKNWASHAQKPEWFTTAPVGAINKVLTKAGKKPDEIDLYEVNEAFSVVSLAVNKLADLPAERVNINGGAVALGHPIGCSGTRILVTLLYAMKRQGSKNGLASLCIGGGEATAVYLERE
jgi:acetyl-CoA C-acetyltransferase